MHAKNRPLCRLTVQRQNSASFELIGRSDIPCTIQFTRLFWVDITNDGDNELFFLTIPPDADGFQRLHAFSTEKTLLELTVHDGVINGSDGVGIKWENDGNFKLLVGLPLAKDGCTHPSCVTLDRTFQVYRWNRESNNFEPTQTP